MAELDNNAGSPPPPPAGFVPVQKMDSGPAAPPPPPAGFVPMSQTPPPPQQQEPSFLDQVGDAVTDYRKGLAKGVLQTTSGLGELIHKGGEAVHPGLGEALVPQSGLTAEKAYATPHGTAQNLGTMGESITEFMLGDEALKGLSMADKFAQVAKMMKLAEKSPRLMNALHVGASTAKAAAELSPEEVELVRSHPILAKTLGIGLDALRAGTIQGAQTTAKTGSPTQGLIEGAGTGAITGGLGAVIGGGAHLLGKGKEAANTVAKMTEIAQHAPSKAAVEDQLSNAVHGAFNSELGTLQNNLDDATSTVGMFGEGAPAQSQITAKAKQFAEAGKKAVHAKYKLGLDKLTEMAGGNTIPFKESPLHKAAQELSAAGEQQAGPLDEALKIERPGSSRVNRIIDNLVGAGEDAAAPEPETWTDHNGVTHTEAPAEMESNPDKIGMKHLVEYRQKLARGYRDLSPTSPDYRADKEVYQKLISGVDDTIGKLADTVSSGDATENGIPSGRKHFDAMNAAYKEGIQPFQNRDVKNILKGNLDNVAKSIMGGQTSLDDITAVKKALGPTNFKQIGQASLQNIVNKFVSEDTGEVDYKKLFQQFGKIDPEVRSAMFGDQGKALASALKAATTSDAGMGEIGKKITSLLGSGDINSVLKNPAQAKELGRIIGPEGMKSLGNSIMESKISEASTALNSKTGGIAKSHFDPDKVLDWWIGMKDTPEIRDAFFTVDKDSAAHYNELMKDLAQVSSVKKLVKYGVLPLTLGTAGVVHGPGAALIGALAGLGTEAGFGRARDILDSMANNPKTWKFLAGAGKAAEGAQAAVPVISGQAVRAVNSQ